MIVLQRDVVRFEKGSILRKDMLESIYDYPRIVNQTYYSRYSDGILYGLEWFEENGEHYISSGALKYKDELYFQTDCVHVESALSEYTLKPGQEYYLYFREEKISDNVSHDTYVLNLAVSPEPVADVFIYKYIKYELGKIKPLDRKIVFGLYASPNRKSFGIPVGVIKDDLLDILDRKVNKHPLDYDILRSVYSGQPLLADFVQLYIKEYNNMEDVSQKIECSASCENVREFIDCFLRAVEELVLPSAVYIEQCKSSENEKADEPLCGSML